MATTMTAKTIDDLKGTINNQNNQITGLITSMSSLRDEIHLIKNELSRFKNDVATDVKYLTDRVDS
tara:strand:- start:239 stop:436 length:198 start_codon:yes stop_codon:yes gene_type:complete